MFYLLFLRYIGGVTVSMLTSSAVVHGIKPLSGQTKDYKSCVCCFSVKHAVFRGESKDWFSQESDWCVQVKRHVYSRTVVSVSRHYQDLIKHVGLVQSRHHHLIECNLSPWYSWIIAHLMLKQQSLMTGATSRVVTTYSSTAPKFIVFLWDSCCSILSFLCSVLLLIVDYSLSFCLFSFDPCMVCPSAIYGFWLSLWYLQLFS